MMAAQYPFVSEVEALASGFAFTEGPTADEAGNVYFVDQPNDRVMYWDYRARRLTTFLSPSGRSNGMHFHLPTGELFSCADEHNQLWVIDPATKEHTVLVREFAGKLLNGPNDVWVHPAGHVYFSDPFYPRDYWTDRPKTMLQDGEHVYHLWPDRRTLRRVTNDLVKPNGLMGTPDGRTLYVADIGAWRTYAFEIREDGSLAGKRLFCGRGSDGVEIDVEGNLYLTGRSNQVVVFDRDGRQVAALELPTKDNTSNVCFGGEDFKTLFITAGAGFYAVRTGTGPQR